MIEKAGVKRMTDHYYSEKPQSTHALKTVTCKLRNHDLTFTTDAGVFSRGRIDFGSRLLIETFSSGDVQGDFLDLGCGYGVVGITLAKEFANRHIVLVDINERAITLSKQNKTQNNVQNVEPLQSDGFSNLTNRKFAAIITNPPIRAGKKLIYSLFADSKEHLHPNGTLWVVIQKKQGAPSAIKYLETIYSHVEVKARKKGYFVLCATK